MIDFFFYTFLQLNQPALVSVFEMTFNNNLTHYSTPTFPEKLMCTCSVLVCCDNAGVTQRFVVCDCQAQHIL